ncbi:hypothetical protein OSB04_un001794 [Centaurea solstitialis]|uniref:Small ribosomal subunit protein uS15c n=3 Tax=Centaureinae TaxID=742011 RepID=A0AA38VUE3_9ASTR|nr:hypothetical protein OSB04_un001794 [Centaurea solstitialis]
MVKNSFISIILQEQEENKENRGSVEFQVVSFTNKIRRLTSHLELHKKDYLSQRGLRKILGKRQRLLAYLSKKNRAPIHGRMNQEKPMTVPSTTKDFMIVNMGPHHPSMHGVLRLIVTLDGEDVIDCEPILGYLHRGMEKIAENRTIIQYLPYVTRWDYLATMFTEAITVNAPEQLGNIQVPKRASYIRVIMLELSRIASHLLWLGPFMADIGAQTPFFYIFRERELIYDLFEAATGMRMMHNFFRIGGVTADLPHGWIDKCLDFCDYFLTGIAEYQKLITQNPVFLERVEGVGIIGGEEAINWGLSGPMLRASGIQWDLRKVDHYECYDEFDWEVQWQKEGDSLARYLVRISEMTESIKIIQQALEGIPGGPYENLEIHRFDRVKDNVWNEFDYRFISKKPSPTFELSKQELYARVEAPKGELGIFLIGDKGVFPWRYKIRPPGFINLQILPQLVKRMKLADIMTILGSIDIIMGEVDRIIIGVLVIVWLEREISAGIQQRIGPEYAGPLGILQALADGTKLLLKENLLPSRGDTRLFSIGPSIAVISILLSYLVIPFGYHLVLADLSIGVFLWIAISSIAPVGLLILSTVDIVEAQSKYGFLGWNLWRQPIGFLVFLISSLAECERLPFDLPEAEEELVADIHDMLPMVTEFMNYGQQTVRAARYIGQGFMITLSHANRLPVTIQYPYEKLITSERFRGRIHFEFDKCIACEVCVRVCPIDLPVVDWKLETDIKKKRLLNYSIDFGICIFCGNCVEYCPTNCLSMTEEYELSTYDRHELNYNQIALGRLPMSVIDDYTIRTIFNLPEIKT